MSRSDKIGAHPFLKTARPGPGPAQGVSAHMERKLPPPTAAAPERAILRAAAALLRVVGTVAVIYVAVTGLWAGAVALIALLSAVPVPAVCIVAAVVADVMFAKVLRPDDEWRLPEDDIVVYSPLYTMRLKR